MLCSGQKGLFAREKVPKLGICKPGARRAGRAQGGQAGLGLRTKTEFIGFQRRRTQTRRLCRPGSRGSGRPWFAYENRIHWLSRETYANWETLPAGFRRVRPALVCVRKPNLLAYRGGVRKPGDFAGRVQEGTAGLGLRTKTEFIGFQRRRTQTWRLCRPSSGGSGRPWFAYENRIHWLTEEAYANREALPAEFRRVRPLKFALENRIY